jgi:hypothetical protein
MSTWSLKQPKKKVELSRCLIKYHAITTSALDRDEWSASRPSLISPREIASGTHWAESWVGPRAGLDAVEGNVNEHE